MKKSRFFLALSFVSLLVVVLPVTAKAAMWDVPVGPGDSFRWVFVTSGARDATSSDISVYNQFVNDAADIGTSISGVVGKSTIAEIDWKAIASTPTTNAIDNIVASSTPIYNPLGTLVANGTSDMFDGSLESSISITETGGVPPVDNPWTWTGTGWNGLAYPHGYELGQTISALGESDRNDVRWIAGSSHLSSTREFPTYAMSEELTVVPVPGALILAATGMFSATLGLNRLRRKR